MGGLADYYWLHSRRPARRCAPGPADQTLWLSNYRGGLPGRQWLNSLRGRGHAPARGGADDFYKRQRTRGEFPASVLVELERGDHRRSLSGTRADSWHFALRSYHGRRPGCTTLPRGRGALLLPAGD